MSETVNTARERGRGERCVHNRRRTTDPVATMNEDATAGRERRVDEGASSVELESRQSYVRCERRRGNVLREDSNEVLVVSVANLLNVVSEGVRKLGLEEVTARSLNRQYVGQKIKLRVEVNARFARFSNAKNVSNAHPLQDVQLPRRLERSDVESCSSLRLVSCGHGRKEGKGGERTGKNLLRLAPHLVLPLDLIRDLILKRL
jgi:hypothetical protein